VKALSSALFTAGVLAVTGLTYGDVFKHIDENGNVTYGEAPISGAKKVEIPPTNVVQSNTLTGKSGSPLAVGLKETAKDDSAGIVYKSLTLVSPIHDQVAEGVSGNVLVKLLPEPALGPNDQLVITVDGEDINNGASTTLALQELSRGSYSVSGRILGVDGGVKIQSDAVIFYVKRPSILIGNAALPPEEDQ